MNAPAHRSSAARWAWLVLGVSVVVLAVTIPLYRSRSSVRTQVSVRTVTPGAAAPRECEVGFAGCSVVAVRATTTVEVRRYFPDATQLDAYGLAEGTRTDTEFVQARTAAGVVVSVQTHCGGGAGTVPDRQYGALAATGPAVTTFVAGGAAGCSVAVTLDVPAGVAVPRSAARVLAHDPALRLS